MKPHWLQLALAITFEVLATSTLKRADGITHVLPFFLAIGAYAISFFCLSLALRIIPLGTAYAIWSGIGLPLICLIGFYHFHQRLDTAAIVGTSLIGIGVMIIGLLSRSVSAP
jgi:small multidrug resistance pump